MKEIAKTQNLLDQFFRDRSRNLAPNSVLAYRKTLTKLEAFAAKCPKERGETAEKHFTRMGDAFLNETEITNKSSFHQYIGIIRSFYTWMYKRGMLEYNPGAMMMAQFQGGKNWEEYEFQKIKERSKACMTEDEVRKILMYTQLSSQRDYMIFLMGFNLALRTDDIANIQRKHFIVSQTGDVQLYVMGKTERKLNKPTLLQIQPREIYDEVIAYMDNWALLNDDDYLITKYYNPFCPSDGISTEPLQARAISERVKKITKDILGREISGHYLRRSRVTTLKMKDVSVPRISKLARMGEGMIRKHYDCEPNKHDLGEHAVMATGIK